MQFSEKNGCICGSVYMRFEKVDIHTGSEPMRNELRSPLSRGAKDSLRKYLATVFCQCGSGEQMTAVAPAQ